MGIRTEMTDDQLIYWLDVLDAILKDGGYQTDLLQQAIERIFLLNVALKPFARHFGKENGEVTLKIGPNSWTCLLDIDDFRRVDATFKYRHPSAPPAPISPEESPEAWSDGVRNYIKNIVIDHANSARTKHL